ncbi:hypothetical protein ILUMI_09513 [Ignelater luminosus]|uniref:Origin recognition complex subunit 2 n=1 Tax=Ignelater luminosus TaxID=2038154 RepID=A0A8K0CZV2_IGNLU|nr:hypothetical protein ILUMI_09513 [Ignelater luminosus]
MPTVVVNGFFPSLTIKNILDSIMFDILGLSENPANAYDGCDIIAQELSHLPTMHLYIIINNIEGDMLKNGKSQNVLSRLGAIKNLHVIGTIDHVSAPLIWDNSKLSKFNFIWCDTTSFLSYVNETSFEGSMIVERSKTLALSSLNNVFLSLTSNSKGIYLIIVKHQLEYGKDQHYQGFLFKDLYWACREAFLASSDLALRSQLTEFVDHKMLKFRRSMDGSEYLIIPTAANILQQFLDEHSK